MARHPRPKAAESANNQIDRYTGIGCFAEGFDHLRVFQLVHLGHDAGVLSGALVLYLSLDQIHPWPHCYWSDEKLKSGGSGVAGEIMEQVHHILRDPRVAGEHPTSA